MCIETILYVGIEGAATGMVGSSGLQESTLEEAELTLAADSISKGTRDLTPLGEAANLDLLFQNTYDSIEAH